MSKCPMCGEENAARKKCGECGYPLVKECRTCGKVTENPHASLGDAGEHWFYCSERCLRGNAKDYTKVQMVRQFCRDSNLESDIIPAPRALK